MLLKVLKITCHHPFNHVTVDAIKFWGLTFNLNNKLLPTIFRFKKQTSKS